MHAFRQCMTVAQVGGAGLAVQDKAEAGPLFGAEVRSLACGDLRASLRRKAARPCHA